MAILDKAWSFTLSNEDSTPPTGKVTRDGSGAIARLGINSHWHPEALGDGFYEMALPQALEYAENIFKYDYWNHIGGYQIQSQLIASKFADLAFNASVDQSTILMQRASNTVWPVATPLTVDGVCGALTVARINLICDTQTEELYSSVLREGSHFYEVLRATHPDKFSASEEVAWLRRLNIRPPA